MQYTYIIKYIIIISSHPLLSFIDITIITIVDPLVIKYIFIHIILVEKL